MKLHKGARVIGEDRAKLGQTWRDMYDDGASIRAIATAYGRSFGNVRLVLLDAGTQLRSRGGKPRK